MRNVFSPENTGEVLRTVIELVVPSRQNVVGEAVIYMEKAVNDFELKQSPVSASPTKSTIEKIRLTSQAPERAITPQSNPKVNQTKQPTSNDQNSQEVNLNVSTARANLNAIFTSIAGDQK